MHNSVYLFSIHHLTFMKKHVYKLKIPKGETFESIMEQRESGAQFMFYEYVIPVPIIAPGRAASKIYFVKRGDTKRYYAKYNLINMIWGWWGLPFGPVYVYKVAANNKKGNNVTDDVYENLSKEDFVKGKVVIRKISTLFMPLDKSSLTELTKCLKNNVQKRGKFKWPPIAGLYTTSKTPTIYVGLNAADFDRKYDLKREVHNYFYSHTRFEFVNLSDASEIVTKLKEQGLPVDCN